MKANSKLLAGALALGLAIPAAAAALPQAKTDHGVTYLSGGVGQDEASALKKEMKNYPLSMVFDAGKKDAYLANVDVTIKDKAGKTVLNTVSDGPIMLVKVPAGKYTISAEEHGKTLRRTAQVKAGHDTRVSFHWPKA
jgi:hypothetical protein